jgi:hypothetical protein
MAITSVEQLLVSAQPVQIIHKINTGTIAAGRSYSQWGRPGIPGPGVFASTAAGSTLDSTSAFVPGQIPFTNPGVGQSLYLINFTGVQPNASGIIILADRLWHNGGLSVTSTGVQTINSVTFPARDINGTTNGVGVQVGLEVSVALGASTTQTITITYTNSDGVAGRTGTFGQGLATGTTVAGFFPFILQDDDKGVRSIQSFQLSQSMTSGTIHLVAYTEIANINAALPTPPVYDAFQLGMPIVPKGAVPFIIYENNATTSGPVIGSVQFGVG